MKVEDFVSVLNCDFYTGVPDSQIKALCNYLMNTYGIDEKHHVIAANEGNCTALAAGYHLSTGKWPVIYMQNSGEGNIINPVVSLLNDKVYGIPAIFVIGWRGEPGVHDEPQHIFQGEITCRLLDLIDINNFTITKSTTIEELEKWIKISGKEANKFFNTSGMLYRQMGLTKKLSDMSNEDKIKLLASDGMLIKRPLIVTKDFVLNGFKEKEWQEHLK